VAGLFLAAMFFRRWAAAIPALLRPGAGAGGRADDGIDCAGGVEGFHGGVPAFVTLVATR